MRSSGFTLLEVLLAVLILGVVVSMVSLSLSGSLQVVEATQKQGEIYHRARTAMSRISEDIAAVRLIDHLEFVGARGDIDGRRADTLQFPSTAHLIFNPEQQQPGLGVITYRVLADPEDQRMLILLRSDTLYLPGGEDGGEDTVDDGFILSDTLRSVEFAFIDPDGEVLSEWDSTADEEGDQTISRLPMAVQCTLSYWLDIEEESFLTFATRVFLPTAIINRRAD